MDQSYLRILGALALLSSHGYAGSGSPAAQVDPKDVLSPAVAVPQEDPWRLSAGMLWRQFEGVRVQQNVETDNGRFFGDDHQDFDGRGAFLMLETPSLADHDNAAFTLSIMYSWAGGGDFRRTTQYPGRTVWDDFSLDLHTISMGPRFVYDIPQVRFSLGAGPTFNWAKWGVSSRMSTIPPGGIVSMQSRANDTFLPGFSVDTTVEFRLSEMWSLLVSGRYDWVRSVKAQHAFSNSSFAYHAQVDGASVLIGLTCKF